MQKEPAINLLSVFLEMQSFHCYSHKSSKVLWDITSNIDSMPLSNKIKCYSESFGILNVTLFLDVAESVFFLVSREGFKVIIFFYTIIVE